MYHYGEDINEKNVFFWALPGFLEKRFSAKGVGRVPP